MFRSSKLVQSVGSVRPSELLAQLGPQRGRRRGSVGSVGSTWGQ
jgi:hypothetical protein